MIFSWVLVAVAAILFVILLGWLANGAGVFIGFIASLVGVYYLYHNPEYLVGVDFFNSIDWWYVGAYLLAYLLIGCAIFAVEYTLQVIKQKNLYAKDRTKILTQYQAATGKQTIDNIEAYERWVKSNYGIDISLSPAKSTIATSIMLWPVMLLRMAYNYFMPFVTALYNAIFGNILKKIKNIMFREFEELNK